MSGKRPRLGEEVPLTAVGGREDIEVPAHLFVTWDSFWQTHAPGDSREAAAVLDCCCKCGGRLTVQISGRAPALFVLCSPCRVVLTAVRLARETKRPP